VEKIPHTIIWGFGSKMNKSEQVWTKKIRNKRKIFLALNLRAITLKMNMLHCTIKSWWKMLIIGHLWLLCSKDVLYVLKSHKWLIMSYFHKDLNMQCFISIIGVIARNFWAKFFFPFIPDFFRSNLFRLVHFWTQTSKNSMEYFFHSILSTDFKFEVKNDLIW
jgi:hypothetical protein